MRHSFLLSLRRAGVLCVLLFLSLGLSSAPKAITLIVDYEYPGYVDDANQCYTSFQRYGEFRCALSNAVKYACQSGELSGNTINITLPAGSIIRLPRHIPTLVNFPLFFVHQAHWFMRLFPAQFGC